MARIITNELLVFRRAAALKKGDLVFLANSGITRVVDLKKVNPIRVFLDNRVEVVEYQFEPDDLVSVLVEPADKTYRG